MFRTGRKLGALTFVALLVASCGAGAPKQGYVMDKKYIAAHWEGGYKTWTEPEYTCAPGMDYSGKFSTQCGIKNVEHSEWEDQHDWVADSWQFYLEDCNAKQKCRKGWLDVDRETYASYKPGMHYPDPR